MNFAQKYQTVEMGNETYLSARKAADRVHESVARINQLIAGSAKEGSGVPFKLHQVGGKGPRLIELASLDHWAATRPVRPLPVNQVAEALLRHQVTEAVLRYLREEKLGQPRSQNER
jgi:hypothetical protein